MRSDVLDVVHNFPFDEVSLGYRTVTLFSPEQLEQGQIGHGVDSDGKSLLGTDEGDWLASWVVIGSEDETGDPIFIDTKDSQFPVFSAMYGQGDWEPYKIAISLIEFISSLSHIKRLSAGRSNPVELEDNPISPKERKQVLKLISKANKGVEMDFWESWLEDE